MKSGFFKRSLGLVRQTFQKASEHKLFQLSGALAYYAMFSIGPLLVMTFGLAGIAFGHDTIRKEIDEQLRGLFGQQVAQTLDSMMTVQREGTSTLTTLAGLVALVFGATGAFSQLQFSLNAIWNVQAKPVKNLWELVRRRFLSLAMVFGTGFLLLISLVLTTVIAALTIRLDAHMAVPPILIHLLNAVCSFIVIAGLFLMIFKFLPDIQIPFSSVWGGAVVTALFFEAGKYLLSLYIGREGFTSSYGAAGAVIALLMWVYYGSLILFLGAEFTQVCYRRSHGDPKISEHAVPAPS